MRSHLRLSAMRVAAAASVAALAGLLACSAADPGSSGGGEGSGTAGNGGGGSSTGAGNGGTTGGGAGTGSGNGATPGGGTTTNPGGGTPTNPGGGTTPTPAADGGTPTTPGTPGTPGTPAAGTISADTTWATGQKINAAVAIAAGVTVTIDPGAVITVADGVKITVAGTLKGVKAAHAKLTGVAWGGLIVDKGGTLSLDGVDLENAVTALDVRATNAGATYANGVITAPTTPFTVAVAGKLTLDHASVVGTKGMASVGGALTATYLDYDSNGNEGVVATDASAIFTIDDSKFHGTSTNGGDMIVANNAATVHVSHTEISKCHCAFHFNAITSFDVSFMNVHDDSYGFMMYGSSAASGKRTVSDSNFTTLAGVGIDEAGTNGLTTVTNCYFNAIAGGNVHLVDAQVKVSAPATAAVPGVGPRP